MHLSLESNSNTLTIETDNFVFKRGEPVKEIYLIKSGKVLLFEMNESRVIPLGVFGEKETLGESSFFDGGVHKNYAITLEESDFVLVPAEKVKKYLSDQAEWINKIYTKVAEKLSSTQEVMVEHKVIDDKLTSEFNFDESFEVKIRKMLKDE